MSTKLQLNQALVIEGMGGYLYTVTATGSYTVRVKSTMLAGSGLRIRLQKNNVTIVTSGGSTDSPTPTQTSLGAEFTQTCVATDTLSVVLDSSVAQDSLPNSVKSTINLFSNEG